MATNIRIYDRVQETTSTAGTGAYDLAGAVTGYQTFSTALNGATEVYYCCSNGTDWEVGMGTHSAGSPDTIARTSILDSSNSGAAVNWAAGSKNIFCTYPALLSQFIDISPSLTKGPVVTAATDAIGIGPGAEASGDSSVSIGTDTNALGAHSWARGANTFAGRPYEDAYSSFQQGKSFQIVLHGTTTNGTPTELFVDDAGEMMRMWGGEKIACEVMLAAHHTNSGGDGDFSGRKYKFAAFRVGIGNPKIIGSVTSEILGEDAGASGWSLSITPGSFGNLKFAVTGEAGKDIKWSLVVRGVAQL